MWRSGEQSHYVTSIRKGKETEINRAVMKILQLFYQDLYAQKKRYIHLLLSI